MPKGPVRVAVLHELLAGNPRRGPSHGLLKSDGWSTRSYAKLKIYIRPYTECSLAYPMAHTLSAATCLVLQTFSRPYCRRNSPNLDTGTHPRGQGSQVSYGANPAMLALIRHDHRLHMHVQGYPVLGCLGTSYS